MATNFEKVVDFNTRFGVIESHKITPKLNILESDPNTVEFCLKLIREEVRELEDAVKNKDYVEVVDALADILYVTYGMSARIGIHMDIAFALVHNQLCETGTLSNFEKIVDFKTNQFGGTELSTELNKLIPKTDILEINPEIIELCLQKNIRDEMVKLEQAVKDKNYIKTVKALTNIVYGVYNISSSIGVNMDKAFALVHDSNMSKLCKTEEIAQRSVKNYEDNVSKFGYNSPAYKKAPDDVHWIVYNKFPSKVLKSIEYNEVDLKSFCYK